LSVWLLLFQHWSCRGGGVTLKHVPAKSLDVVKIVNSAGIMIADVGDARDVEPFDRIGQGVSCRLPVSFYARDAEEKELAVSYYVAQNLSEDLNKIGYKTRVANDAKGRKPLSLDESIDMARREGNGGVLRKTYHRRCNV